MEQKKSAKKFWFKRKRYGWGWGMPNSWEGWVVLLGYVLLLFWNFRSIDAIEHSGSDTLISFAPRLVTLSIILIVICFWKGEKPKWSWGKD